MKLKNLIVLFVFLSLAFVFLHSEFGVACECHDHEHHDLHDFNNLISNTLISKSFKLFEHYVFNFIAQSQIIDLIAKFEFSTPIKYFYDQSVNLFTLKLPTFSFLQTFLF